MPDPIPHPIPHVDSWYAKTARPASAWPVLEGDVEADVVVVGGGYTGLSAALELAGRGYAVALLESHRIGWGASGRNGGHVVTGFNKPMSTIERLVGRDDARLVWQLGQEAMALLAERVQRHRIACGLKWGYLTAALKPRHLDDLARHLDDWQAFGYYRARMVDRTELPDLVASPIYLGGLYDPGSGHLHPLDYALGLADAAAAAGVRIFEGSGVLQLEEGATVTAATRRGRVKARFAAVACNAYLPPLSPGLTAAARSRIMPVGTYMIATEPLGEDRARALIPSGIAVADANFVLNYYRLSPDHRMLFGGGVSYSTLTPPALARGLAAKMARHFPGLSGVGVDHVWGGNVAITLNRLPHVGRSAPNVFFAQGYSGHGVALSGIAGRLIAEAIAGTAERFDAFARLPHAPFPGGRLMRMPALVLAMTWYRLRDLL